MPDNESDLTQEDQDPVFRERVISLLERLLQTSFCETEQARSDVETLISCLKNA